LPLQRSSEKYIFVFLLILLLPDKQTLQRDTSPAGEINKTTDRLLRRLFIIVLNKSGTSMVSLIIKQ
jgi:hypothetical protein